MQSRKKAIRLYGSNKFGCFWALLLIFPGAVIANIVSEVYPKAVCNIGISIIVVYMLRNSFTEVVNHLEFIVISSVCLLLNTALFVKYQFTSEQNNEAAGVMLFLILPMVCISFLYAYKSKASKAINQKANL